MVRFGGSTAYLVRLWAAKAAHRAALLRRGNAEEEAEEEEEEEEVEMSAPRGFKPLALKTSKFVSNARHSEHLLAPPLLVSPKLHTSQAVAPRLGWNLPVGQGSHDD